MSIQRELRRDLPELPAPVEVTTSSLFAALTHLRGPRVFHPHGRAFDCTLTLVDNRLVRNAGLEPGQEYSGLARLSRSAGLPAPLPDARGIGLRLFDFPAGGNVQDLLFVTSASPRVLRRTIVFTGGFLHRIYSTLLNYDLGGHRVVLALRPVAGTAADTTLEDLAEAVRAGAAAFSLDAAAPWGSWEQIGALRLERGPAAWSRRGPGVQPVALLGCAAPDRFPQRTAKRRVPREPVGTLIRLGARREAVSRRPSGRPEAGLRYPRPGR